MLRSAVPTVPRYRVPNRAISLKVTLDDVVGPHHPARLFWELFGHLDLHAFDREVKAVEGRAGRRPHSPQMLLTLWAYAFSQGIVHARAIARRVQTDLAFRWIVGDLAQVDHSVLSDFLRKNRAAIAALVPAVARALISGGWIGRPGDVLAQDGVKIRANASMGSNARAAPLDDAITQAELHLHAVLARLEDPPPERGTSSRACARRDGRVVATPTRAARARRARRPPRA